MKHITTPYGIDRLVNEFQQYLQEAKGLAPSTCARCLTQAREFLTAQWKRARHDLVLARLSAPEIVRHLARQQSHYPPGGLQQYGSTVRVLLRFLVIRDLVPPHLIHAVPSVRAQLPRRPRPYLTRTQLQTLLAALDPQTAVGARDQALFLMLAQMGLRAGEAARLTLEDVNWDQGALRLRCPKGRLERLLPLPPEVKQSLGHYLHRARPKAVEHRHVFVGFPSGRGLSNQRVSQIVGAALRHAGLDLPRPGAHVLRHTFATRLAHSGASIKGIADWLGHRQLDTACRYIQMDLTRLQRVVQPWPEARP